MGADEFILINDVYGRQYQLMTVKEYESQPNAFWEDNAPVWEPVNIQKLHQAVTARELDPAEWDLKWCDHREVYFLI